MSCLSSGYWWVWPLLLHIGMHTYIHTYTHMHLHPSQRENNILTFLGSWPEKFCQSIYMVTWIITVKLDVFIHNSSFMELSDRCIGQRDLKGTAYQILTFYILHQRDRCKSAMKPLKLLIMLGLLLLTIPSIYIVCHWTFHLPMVLMTF